MHALNDLGILERHAVAEPPFERLLEERVLVQLREHFGNGVARDVACDAERLDLADHAGAAAVPEAYFGARAGERCTPIVERPLLAQARERGVDVVLVEFALEKPRPQLGFRELAAREQGECDNVRAVGVVRHAHDSNRRRSGP